VSKIKAAESTPPTKTVWEHLKSSPVSPAKNLRIAFCGASGTGKTTLSTYLCDKFDIPFNPVGSRSVSKAMGFESPYDVDKAGKRAEFQRRLVREKRAWEDAQTAFVSDRTTLDNLAYTMFHDIGTVDEAFFDEAIGGTHRYTHIIYCPVEVFCNPGSDPSRVHDMTYHKLYDTVIEGLVQRHLPKSKLVKYARLDVAGQVARRTWLDEYFAIDLRM
jgi:GTPase SAR1 family protein